MNEYKLTKDNYNKAVSWHTKKSRAYNWSKQIDSFVAFLKGNKVLDAGCGGSDNIRRLKEKGINPIGLDFSEATIEKCKQELPHLTFYVGNIMDLKDFEGGSFDGIWSSACLLNLKKIDVPKAIMEFRRILKSEGIMYVSVKEGVGETIVDDQAGKRLFSLFSYDEIKQLIEDAGFIIVKHEIVKDRDVVEGKEEGKPNWICIYAKKVK